MSLIAILGIVLFVAIIVVLVNRNMGTTEAPKLGTPATPAPTGATLPPMSKPVVKTTAKKLVKKTTVKKAK